jgi:hypothetical protein
MFLIAFSSFNLSAQTYTNQVEMECLNTPGCEKIVIQVNTTITDNTSLECGEFDVAVTFDILLGASCIDDPDEDIYRVRWYVGPDFLNYNPRRETSVHFSRAGGNALKLKFAVRTICGTIFHKEVLYQITNPEACSGCYSAVSYCDLYCNPDSIYNDVCDSIYYDANGNLLSQIPKIYELVLFSTISPHVIHINQTYNYGIFNIPYYARDEQDCPNLTPGLYEFVEDMNTFLDLYRTGDSEYDNNYGHVCLMDSYGDITEAGDTDKCKIRINFVDMGMFFYGFHEIRHYEFDLQECEVLEPINGEDEHFDPRFGYDDSCISLSGNIINSDNADNYLINILHDNYIISSIDEHEYNNRLSFMCYPTISSDKFDVIWEASYEDPVSIKIINTSGTIIESINDIKRVNSISIKTQDYPKGIYFVLPFDFIYEIILI